MTAATAQHHDLRRWVASAIVALGAHAVAATMLLTWRDPIGLGASPEATVVIDLAPFVPSEKGSTDAIPLGPKQEQTEPPPTEQRATAPRDDETVEVPAAPEPPVAALPPSVAMPPVAPPVSEVAKPKPAERAPSRPRKPVSERPSHAATAPPPPHVSPDGAKAWYGDIVARINRHKSYPQVAMSRGEKGVVELAFSVNREGRVVSSRIVRSSSYAELDREALATVRRAQPFPPPPPGARLDFTMPIAFSVR
jgi:periplasmic protein TonB